MTEFENLTNEQLRLKLLEYGFSNMPVTQTTRKVLLKKLNNFVDGEKSKLRRETIHITKYSSDDESGTDSGKANNNNTNKKDANRRATISVGASKNDVKVIKTAPITIEVSKTPTTIPVELAKEKEKVNRRRSSRNTPVKEASKQPVAAVPNEPKIFEDSDDDDLVLATMKLDRERNRKSKSPSLTKSQTVTTSYIQVSEPEKKKPREVILEDLEPEILDEDVLVVDDDDEEPLPMIPVRKASPQRRLNINSNKRTTITSPLTATTKQTTFESNKLINNLRSPVGGSNYRSSISTSYNYNKFDDQGNNDKEQFNVNESPYLSEFTRRLSRIRTDNVAASGSAGASAIDVRKSLHYPTSEYYRGGQRHYQLQPQKDGLRESIKDVIVALDRKYSIKRIFFFLILLFIVIFVYVFFFM
uniref:Putative otefin n=1 Tax=Corethrella appendiculata TaxID=1370023 RepID=U5EXI0_9DIPT